MHPAKGITPYGGREGGREGEREGGREGGREGREDKLCTSHNLLLYTRHNSTEAVYVKLNMINKLIQYRGKFSKEEY